MTAYQSFKYDDFDGQLRVARPAVSTTAIAVAQSLHDVSLLLGRTEDGVACRGAELSWAYTGRRGLNRVVMRTALTPERAAARVSDVVVCFNRWSSPVTWVTRGDLATPELEAELSQAGFRPGPGSVGVAAALSVADLARTPSPALAGLTVETATSSQGLAAWAHVHEGHGIFDAIDGAADVFSPAHLGGNPRCRFYTATGNDTGGPVARVLSYTNGKTVGLYWLAARADHRGRGLELALAARALDDARRAGAKLAVTSTRATDEPTWIQAGFARHCQFKTYRWTPTGC